LEHRYEFLNDTGRRERAANREPETPERDLRK